MEYGQALTSQARLVSEDLQGYFLLDCHTRYTTSSASTFTFLCAAQLKRPPCLVITTIIEKSDRNNLIYGLKM